MSLDFQRFQLDWVTLRFVQKGRAPSWLIHTGTHGDESGIIESVRKFLENHGDRLPDFLWVPEVSPTAVWKKTRRNYWGHDVNREFRDGADDPEVKANLELIGYRGFRAAVLIHEDPALYGAFYLYDSFNVRGDVELGRMFRGMAAHKIRPFTGIDDEDDPMLGSGIVNGYYSEVEDQDRKRRFPQGDGTAMDYLGRRNVASLRRLNAEFPGKASQAVKDALVAEFFEYLIRWWYGSRV